MMNTCGWCIKFTPNSHSRHIVAGWFVGDGRCKVDNSVTVIGSSCEMCQTSEKTEAET